jgi:hypothetical protein
MPAEADRASWALPAMLRGLLRGLLGRWLGWCRHRLQDARWLGPYPIEDRPRPDRRLAGPRLGGKPRPGTVGRRTALEREWLAVGAALGAQPAARG